MTADENRWSRASRSWPGAIALLVACLVAYWPALQGAFLWDDDSYVENNRAIKQGFDGLLRIWTDVKATPQYYPLVHTSYWIEHHLWGLNPRGYHATNILLHALAAWLLGILLHRLKVPGAPLAAWLFALHPVAVESVAWIAERKNVLAMFCSLLALNAFWLALPNREGEDSSQSEDDRRHARWGAYAAFLGCFAAAMFSKTVAVAAPPAILVLLWREHGRLRWIDVGRVAPAIALAVPLALTTVRLEKTRVLAVGPEFDQTFAERLLIAGRAPWFYLGKLLYPWPLAFSYERWDLNAGDLWQWLYPLATVVLLATLAVIAWRWPTAGGRSPLATILLFGGALFPALGFFSVYPFRYSFVADHFQHLAMPVPLAFLAAIVAWTCFGERAPAWRRAAGTVVVVAALIACGTLTWLQCHDYRDRETLWVRTLEKSPRASLAMNNLAEIRVGQGRNNEALALFEQAVAVAPLQMAPRVNVGIERFVRREYAASREAFESALALHVPAMGRVPEFDAAQLGLARLDARDKNWNEAKRRLEATLAESGYADNQLYAAAGLWATCRILGDSQEADRSRVKAEELLERAMARDHKSGTFALRHAMTALRDFGMPDLAEGLKARLRRATTSQP